LENALCLAVLVVLVIADEDNGLQDFVWDAHVKVGWRIVEPSFLWKSFRLDSRCHRGRPPQELSFPEPFRPVMTANEGVLADETLDIELYSALSTDVVVKDIGPGRPSTAPQKAALASIRHLSQALGPGACRGYLCGRACRTWYTANDDTEKGVSLACWPYRPSS
jgi:hypothetical protein